MSKKFMKYISNEYNLRVNLVENLPSYSCLLRQFPIFNDALCLLLVLVLMLIEGIILVRVIFWNVLIERAFYVIPWYTMFFIKMRACILSDDVVIINLGFLFLFVLYEFTFLFTYFVATGCEEWSRSIHAERIIFLEMARESHKIVMKILIQNSLNYEQTWPVYKNLQATLASPSSYIVKKVLRLEISVYSYPNVSNIQMHMWYWCLKSYIFIECFEC